MSDALRVIRPMNGFGPYGSGTTNGNGNGNGNGVAHGHEVAPANGTAPAATANGAPALEAAGSNVDMARIEAGVREMLAGLGEDVGREGLADTPARVARAYREMLGGMGEDAGEHLGRVFPQEQSGDDVVMLRNIQFTSLCEHHMLPFTGVAHVAYLPSHGQVTGLSKLARTVDVYARRLQMQERLTGQVADALAEHLDPRGVVVVMEAEHSCMRLRGARKDEARMVTTAFRGAMADDRALRSEVLSLMGVGR